MTTLTADIRLVGHPSQADVDCLRETLLDCHRRFGTYRRGFEVAGIGAEDLLASDPVELLGRLDTLNAEDYSLLADESLAVTDAIIDMETSSGTTARPKRRFISAHDASLEEEFLADMFAVCGIGPSDRVACLDVDPLAVMASFTAALESLGVRETYAYTFSPSLGGSLAGLSPLDPTVLISVPSIIERCLPVLTSEFAKGRGGHLSKVVYVGESLSAKTRRTLETKLGVEVFGYYGATETSALGIECAAHDGIHLFSDRNLFEVQSRGEGATGELLVTSLRLRSMPLLRYALGDVIEPKPGPCECGLDYPRIEVLGRSDESVSVLGASIGYEALYDAVYDVPGESMQLVVTGEARDLLTIVLPEELEPSDSSVRDAVLAGQPDLEFLVTGGYVDFEFSYTYGRESADSRKLKRVVDLRESHVG
ncbi:MAG: AMP-binding protein [Chloroflexi bacterium]|nr:AMP-binding protein [Chloroflexota bacterium]